MADLVIALQAQYKRPKHSHPTIDPYTFVKDQLKPISKLSGDPLDFPRFKRSMLSFREYAKHIPSHLRSGLEQSLQDSPARSQLTTILDQMTHLQGEPLQLFDAVLGELGKLYKNNATQLVCMYVTEGSQAAAACSTADRLKARKDRLAPPILAWAKDILSRRPQSQEIVQHPEFLPTLGFIMGLACTVAAFFRVQGFQNAYDLWNTQLAQPDSDFFEAYLNRYHVQSTGSNEKHTLATTKFPAEHHTKGKPKYDSKQLQRKVIDTRCCRRCGDKSHEMINCPHTKEEAEDLRSSIFKDSERGVLEG